MHIESTMSGGLHMKQDKVDYGDVILSIAFAVIFLFYCFFIADGDPILVNWYQFKQLFSNPAMIAAGIPAVIFLVILGWAGLQ